MRTAILIIMAVLGYLLFWPVAVTPVAWQAPINNGYVGDFIVNQRLATVEVNHYDSIHGAEDMVIDTAGRLYLSNHDGRILRLSDWHAEVETFADTGGRPLGMEFSASGELIVADAYKGLLSITPDGSITVLTDSVNGEIIGYADDVDIAADGRIYFSDASSKFAAAANGGTYAASLLDIMEHGGHGRLLRYDPRTGHTEVVLAGLEFANGVAISADQQSVLVVETALYRVLRVYVDGAREGVVEVVIDNLPGFPDNINRALDGDDFWLGLVSPRDANLDALAPYPWLRKLVQRLPSGMRPKARNYGHVVKINAAGTVLQNLQDPNGSYPQTTGVLETADYWYISSLSAAGIARLPRQ
jgi:sugar lactone lactonase YvrE